MRRFFDRPEPDLIWWLCADTGLFQDTGAVTPAAANNDPVALWQDQSGYGHHVLQATGSKQPLLKTGVLNGLPVVNFDGVDDFLKAAAADGVTDLDRPLTVFVVAKAAAAHDGTLFSSVQSSQGDLFRYRNNAGTQQVRWLSPQVDLNTGIAAGTFSLFTVLVRLRFGQGGTLEVRVNGAFLGSGGGSRSGSFDGNAMAVGALPTGTLVLNGAVREIRAYRGLQSENRINQIGQGLLTQTGLG